MTELYSIKEAARIFDLQESRLRYWLQTGFITPSVRRGGRFFYTFQDLVSIKTAAELLEAGLPTKRVRKNLEALRRALPDEEQPMSRLRICSDGDSVVAVDEDLVYEPASGQLVMAFAVSSLSHRAAEVLALRRPQPVAPLPAAAPQPIADDQPTEGHPRPSAYRYFLDGCEADDRGEIKLAEECYRRALDLEPSLAAARTNLGTLYFQRGEIDEARQEFEQALEYEPSQPEARFNLGNLLASQGETEHAIAELRRVCTSAPDFADAHYNLGLILAEVGGMTQAQQHLQRYLELDNESEWAERSREFLASM